jgi:DNA-binding transcriptional LysR family regulator
MELRHLRSFVAIAEERSFTRAAERLWIAQPGLSAQVKQLEGELGVRLFDRHTRGVDLTDAGALFLERARTVVAAAEDALATGQDMARGLVGAVRVGFAMSARSSLGEHLLEAFADNRPNIEVTVVEAYGGVVVREVADGRLDAAVVPLPFAAPDLHHAPFGSESLIVAVGPGHRLAGTGPVSLSELDGEEVVVTGHRDGVALDSAVAGLLGAAGVSHSTHRGGWGPSMFGRVADGRAVAVTTRPSIDRPGVLTRDLEPRQAMPFALVWRAPSPAPPLLEFIRLANKLARPGASRHRARALAAA